MAISPVPALQQKEVQHLRQMQRLMMLPQMQQALHLLQLPIMELADVMRAHLELNPLLLVDPDAEGDDDELERLLDDAIEEPLPPLNEERPLLFSERDFVRLQRLDEELYGQEKERGTERSFQEQSLRSIPTLFEQLMMQIGQMTQDPQQLVIAELLIGNLSATGYLTISLEELATTHQISLAQLQHILRLIQTVEPVGIGATTVQEALLLQLNALKESQELQEPYALATRIVSHCYQELLHNQIPQIEKRLKCTRIELQAALKQISRLHLHPGSGYGKEEAQAIVPDVIVNWEGDHFAVEINEDPLPVLSINRRYLRLLEDPTVSVDVKEFVRHKLSATKWLLRTIDQRQTTLYKLTEMVVKKQQEFLTQRGAPLHPLTMQAVAEEMGVNPSTVVRAVANKYLASPRGLLPLRSLFTQAGRTTRGEEVSTHTIREALRVLIDKEDKQHPLTDAVLAACLHAQGFSCARRTVAKYRVDLKEGNVRQRKKH